MRNLGLSIPASAFLLATTAVPTAWSDFSLSPTFPSSILSHSRTSLATLFDSTGKLTYAPNNLLTYSNTFSNAAWTKSAYASIVGGVSDPFGGTNAFTFTAAGAAAGIYQNVTGNASTNYISSIWIRRRTGTGEVTYYKPNDSASTNIGPSLTGSWQQFSAISAGAPTTAWLDLVIATSGDAIDIYAATVSAVTYETTPRTGDQVITTSAAYYGPRIDYDPNTLAVNGLLIEEARTNVFTYSNDLTNALWVKSSVTVTAGAATGPDGTASLARLTRSAGGQFYRNTALAANTKTIQFVAKKDSLDYVGTSIYNGVGAAYFNLANGTVANTVNGTATVTASIDNLGGGLYKCKVTFSGTFTAVEYHIEPSDGTNTSFVTSWTGGGTGSVFVGYVQSEDGATFATSYIPTAASSVTRAADVVQFTGAALTALQGSLWTFFVEATAQAPYSTNPALWGYNGNNLVQLDGVGHTNFYLGGNLAQPANTATAFAAFRSGTSKTATGISAVLNGGTINKFTGAVTPVLTSVSLGTAISTNNLNGWFKSFAIYSQALPDATLQAKSVVGASYS